MLSDKVFAWVSDAEHNKPRLRGNGRDAFGRWKGELITGEGWRKLQDFGLAKGFVPSVASRFGLGLDTSGSYG